MPKTIYGPFRSVMMDRGSMQDKGEGMCPASYGRLSMPRKQSKVFHRTNLTVAREDLLKQHQSRKAAICLCFSGGDSGLKQ